MFLLPTAKDLRDWQIWAYTQRLKVETNKKAIIFLKKELKNFGK